MDKLMTLCVVFAAAFVCVSGSADSQIVKEYCEITLRQTQNDTIQCYEKPSGYESNWQKPVIIYLCCLGYFLDVRHNYIPFLAFDMLQYIVEMTNERYVLSIANFVMTCKTDNYILTKADFLHWNLNGQVAKVCRAN